jgi:ubiquinone/menaquinone biosynthesis C-methylase UbiE
MEYEKKLVESFWSEVDCSATDRNFYSFPPIRARSCRLLFDQDDFGREDWCEYWTVEKYLKDKIPVEKCLSICCGFGAVERILVRLNVAQKIFGTDVASGAVKSAAERAKAEGLNNIEYYVSDLNYEDLPQEEYDIIWANGALHHIKEIESLVARLKNALKTGGVLICNEYVGPNYQQLDSRHQEIINAVKHILPPELREEWTYPREYGGSMLSKLIGRLVRFLDKRFYKSPNIYGQLFKMSSVEDYLYTDPSECINSSKIIPTLQGYFDDIEVKYYNGSILHYALDSRFYANFDIHNNKHQAFLESLFQIEDTLTGTGEIPNINAHIICKKG